MHTTKNCTKYSLLCTNWVTNFKGVVQDRNPRLMFGLTLSKYSTYIMHCNRSVSVLPTNYVIMSNENLHIYICQNKYVIGRHGLSNLVSLLHWDPTKIESQHILKSKATYDMIDIDLNLQVCIICVDIHT